MNTLGELKAIASNFTEATNFANIMIDEIGEGMYNPFEVLTILKLNIDMLDAVYRSEVLRITAGDELAKYPKETTKAFGFEISKGSKTTYDFTTCNDSLWSALQESLSLKKKELAERENFLKAIKVDFGIADTDSGEVLLPPARKTTDFFKLTKK